MIDYHNEPDEEFSDMIYLQPGAGEEGSATWCEDQINDDDIAYVRATPTRKAAPALLEACRVLIGVVSEWDGEGLRACGSDFVDAIGLIRDAVKAADGQDHQP